MLRFELDLVRGAFHLRARGHCSPGETLVLFGPSGAGKTTILRLVAGLIPGAGQTIALGSATWAGPGVDEPPWKRRAAYLAAEAPFVLRRPPVRGLGVLPAGWLEALEVDQLHRRPAGELSRGERQRFALLRALSAGPAALLLDEALDGLDAPLAARVAGFVDRWAKDSLRPVLLATHELGQVGALGGPVLLVSAGEGLFASDPHALLSHPPAPRWARLLGYRLVPLERGLVGVRPEHLRPGRFPELGPSFHAEVLHVRPHGAGWLLAARGPGDTPLEVPIPPGTLPPAAGGSLEITAVGAPVYR